MIESRICKQCRIEFVPKRDSDFCSRSCLFKYRYEQNKEKYVCDVCGKDYMANKYNNRRRKTNTCSRACANKARWEKDRKPHIFIDGVEYKECLTCGLNKLLINFAKDKNKWDGLCCICRSCYRIYINEIFSKTEKGVLGKKRAMANRRVREKQLNKLTPKVIKEVYDGNINKFGKLTCVYCGNNCEQDWHLEHKIPICKDGTNDKENLTIACPICNLTKGRKTVEEFMKLKIAV